MQGNQIGSFVAELRKEKRLTQEQLAEKLGVTNRSISRWENGRTLPDYSLMRSLCDEFGVSMEELLNGKRKQQTDKQTDTAQLIMRLLQREIDIKKSRINRHFCAAFLCLLGALLAVYHPAIRSDGGVLSFVLTGLGVMLFFRGLWINNMEHGFTEKQIKLLYADESELKMRTAEEMLCFAKKYQKVDLKQYRLGFQKIEEVLAQEEYALFAMVNDGYSINENTGPWHGVMVMTNSRILLTGERMKGMLLSSYIVDAFDRKELHSITAQSGKIRIQAGEKTFVMEGDSIADLVTHFPKG